MLRKRIEELEGLHDQDLQPVIEAKRSRLEQLLVTPTIDQKLLEELTDPQWFAPLAYDRLASLLHQVVACILITKQAPTGLSLRI